MITIRGLLAFSLLAVLGGCASTQCAAPTKLSSDPPITCLYQIQVTAIDSATNSVTGKVPNVLVIEVEDEYKYKYKDLTKDGTIEFPTPKSEKSEIQYTFSVNNSASIVPGQIYEFIRVGNYPELGLGKKIVHEEKK